MKKMFLTALCVATVVITTQAQNSKVVTAAQANGVYRYYKSEFRILALGHNKLKIQFDGIYMTLAKSPNMGYASGEATIDGNVATFVPPDTQRCKITITFLPGKLKVKRGRTALTQIVASVTTSTPPECIARSDRASQSSNLLHKPADRVPTSVGFYYRERTQVKLVVSTLVTSGYRPSPKHL